MFFLKKSFFAFILMFCFLPHAFLQGTPLFDPESDLFKEIPISVRQPATTHHRPTFFGRSLEQALVPTSTLCSQKDQTSAFKSALSWAVWPFDLCKKASLCVLKSSWLFVATTGALLPNANALFTNGITRSTLYSFGLTDNWDINTCKGRALDANDTQRIHDKKHDCHNYFCMQRPSYLCNKLRLAESEDHKDMFEKLCDTSMCAPRVVLRSSQRYIQEERNYCIEKECQQLGHPYTGHFFRAHVMKDRYSAACRKVIDKSIFKSEECFDPFCQQYAQSTCIPSSWWQSVFNSSPCNRKLCPGRFVPEQSKEVSPGVFKTLEELGEETIEKCKETLLQAHSIC
ncbi:MAG: hypothetical protein V6Z78_03560 [Holosporaceae bacterium]